MNRRVFIEALGVSLAMAVVAVADPTDDKPEPEPKPECDCDDRKVIWALDAITPSNSIMETHHIEKWDTYLIRFTGVPEELRLVS